MYSNKTIKELKQILEEHNCAVPNGAKKKDLVELVEAIMSKDEDFVTMQVENEFDIFEENATEEEAAVIKEVVGSTNEESRPSMFSDEWNPYVMAHFHTNELIDGNPICAGLRRVAELLLGDIIESGPEQVFPATDGMAPDRATVVFKVVFDWMNTGQQRVFKEVADVWHGNTDDLFCAHPVATASTRAEGRALRKALKLRVLAAEELARKDIVEIVKQSVKSANRIDGITNQQIQFMDNFCSRFDINVLNFINMGKETYPSIYEINKDKAAQMIKHLNQYQKPDNEVPDSIKGYDTNWRSE